MPFYSNSSKELQQRFDSARLADQLERTRRHAELTDDDLAIINAAEFFFAATADRAGRPDCSIKGGNAGFIAIDGPRNISFPNYDGNGMFRSLGNIAENPWIGLLFVVFGDDPKKLRINGRARLTMADAARPEQMRIEVEIADIFPNCPRYLPSMQIKQSSVFNPAAGYEPPEPFWKSKPDLKPYLPDIRPVSRDAVSKKNEEVS
jgi:uncharacterized protein